MDGIRHVGVLEKVIIKLTARHSSSMRTAAIRTAAIVATLTVGPLGCRAAALAYGPDATSARANADGVMSALEQRFTRVVRVPKFANARMRLARYAMAPSKLVGDTSIWTASRSIGARSERELEVFGSLVDGRYTFVTRRPAAPLTHVGEARHFIGLQALDNDDGWRWTTTVDHAVGPMPPERAADVMRAFFASAERTPSSIRVDYRAAFPRASEAFGRMLAVDSISTVMQVDGSTLVTLQIATSDLQLRDRSPALAKFIRRYVESSGYHIRLTDKSGGEWFDASAKRGSRLVIRFRSHDGELQPLSGAARHMPDTLVLNMDAQAKLSFFTVGVSNLVGEFVHVHTASERGWAMRFTKEPSWQLPPLAEQLLHSPLQRPFVGDGIQFRIGYRRGTDGQTFLSRSVVLAVQESAIMRFLGTLGFTAMSDYAGQVEEEENRFLAEGFAALRTDIAALNR